MVLRSLAFAAFLACPALVSDACAADVWVDPINGDDANGGTSEADAWRTVTYALVQLGPVAGPEVDVVHVLPGQYNLAGGENFPLVLRDKVRLEGQGHAGIIIFSGQITIGEDQESTSWETGLTNLTLDSPGIGVKLRVEPGNPAIRRATLRSVTFREKSTGVRCRINEPAMDASGVRLDDCTFEDCTIGLSIRSRYGAHTQLSMRDSRMLWSSGYNTNLVGYAEEGGILDLEFEHCQFVIGDQATYGFIVRDYQTGNTSLRMFDCALVSPCLSTYGIFADGSVHLERCTLAGHDTALNAYGTTDVLIRDCVFGDNDTDLWSIPGAHFQVENTIIDDPMALGHSGNFAASPNFVDPFSGDYRLAHGSAGLDCLPPLDTLDLDGVPRNQDGDLDSIGMRDIGAYETRTLFGPSSAALGAPLTFELQGFDGEFALLYLSRVPTSAPWQSPFGAAWLTPGTLSHVQDTITSGATLTQVTTTAPAHAALAGTTLGFQALMRSPASPTGAAWSSPVLVTLQ
ncbi:MAG: hypothetical protein ACI8QC_003210 [Planctomycetota bacterium]|jgi:hypothetical protein